MSALLAVDFYPRTIIGCNSDSCHAYPEVYIGTGTKAKNLLQDLAKRLRTTINYHIDTDDRYWLSLDWTSFKSSRGKTIGRTFDFDLS